MTVEQEVSQSPVSPTVRAVFHIFGPADVQDAHGEAGQQRGRLDQGLVLRDGVGVVLLRRDHRNDELVQPGVGRERPALAAVVRGVRCSGSPQGPTPQVATCSSEK